MTVPPRKSPSRAAGVDGSTGTHRFRACEACRPLKVRCIFEDGHASCKRCTRLDHPCVVTVPKRKRHAQTDTRILELEKKIVALQADVQSTAQPASMIPAPPILQESPNLEETPNRTPLPETTAYIDVVDKRIIDDATAYWIFGQYHSDMCFYYPLVVFPPSVSAQEIRRTKPMLFLAILAAAAPVCRPDLQSILFNELTQILAGRILYRGERSLELVQTLQILSLYYAPSDDSKHMNYNQMIHIAVVMALDLGMGKRLKPGTKAPRPQLRNKETVLPDPNAAETRRAWLGCYLMCTSVALSLRRPLLVRWSSYNDECLEVLTTASDTLPSDEWLCHLVRGQHIAEEVAFQFSMDDATQPVSPADPRVQYHLKAFEQQLYEWRQHATMCRVIHPALVQHVHAILNLYIHEIGMHYDHSVDDFKPADVVQEGESMEADFASPAHVESLITCLESIHNAFEAYLAMDLRTLRGLPNIFLVRNSYAAVALVKVYGAIAVSGSKLCSMFRETDLKVGYYLTAMTNAMSKVTEANQSRVANRFSSFLETLQSWHIRRESAPVTQTNSPRLANNASNAYKNLVPDPSPNGRNLQNRLVIHSDNNNPQVGAANSDVAPPMFSSSAFVPTDANTMPPPGFGYMDFNDFGFSLDELSAMETFMKDPQLFNMSTNQAYFG